MFRVVMDDDVDIELLPHARSSEISYNLLLRPSP